MKENYVKQAQEAARAFHESLATLREQYESLLKTRDEVNEAISALEVIFQGNYNSMPTIEAKLLANSEFEEGFRQVEAAIKEAEENAAQDEVEEPEVKEEKPARKSRTRKTSSKNVNETPAEDSEEKTEELTGPEAEAKEDPKAEEPAPLVDPVAENAPAEEESAQDEEDLELLSEWVLNAIGPKGLQGVELQKLASERKLKRTSLTKALKKLTEENRISIDGKFISLVDLEAEEEVELSDDAAEEDEAVASAPAADLWNDSSTEELNLDDDEDATVGGLDDLPF